MEKEVIICLDIGGTNCRIGLVDREYEIYAQQILATAGLAEGGFMNGLLQLIEEYRETYQEDFQINAVSLGFPSTIDRTRRKLLSTPNIEGMDNLEVADILEERLALPVYLERDVNLLLLYDLFSFRLEEESTVIGVYFGTGIGNGIYMNGKLLYGRNGVAGELGHIPQLHADTVCGCGNTGCIEPIGGGRCLEELCTGTFAGTRIRDIYKKYRDTPELKTQVEAMSIPVATEINILDPDYVILGGGLLQMEGFPLKSLEENIYKHTRKPYPAENLRFLYSNVNQENGIIGAGIYGWKKWKEVEKYEMSYV